MKARRIAAAALAACLALGATACSSSGTPSGGSSAEDTKTFDFWSFTGIDQKQSVEEYQKKHPDVTVNLTEVGSSVETAQALTTALAGGKVPDLVLIQGDDLPKFMTNPANFKDLKEFGAGDISGDYLDWVMAQSTTPEGQIVGIPTDVGGMAMSYRVDKFKAAGLPTDPDEVSKLWPTWDDYLKVAKQYKEKTGEPFMDNASTTVFYQAVNQVSQKYYDNNTREPIYDTNPEVKAAFELGIQAATSGTTANLGSFTQGWSAAMANGDFATVATPSWMLGSIKSSAPKTEGLWDIATIPGGGKGNWGGSYLAIPAGAKNPVAAWNYIKEMQSPESQLNHFLESGSLPTTPSVYTDPKLLAKTDPFFNDAPIGKIFTQSVDGLKTFYIGLDSSTIGAEFQAAIDNVEDGKGDPNTAFDTAVTNIKTALGG
jgi:cellobiose transport system substrate-binding protein